MPFAYPTTYASTATGTLANWVTVSTSSTANVTVDWSGWTVTYDHLAAGSIRSDHLAARVISSARLGAPDPESERRREFRATTAQSRARELLRALLSDEQWQDYLDHEYFDVLGSLGNVYRIRPGSAGNVRLLAPNGQEIAALCAHPVLGVRDEDDRYVGSLPDADVAVGQLLALMTDERDFFRRANRHWARPGSEEVFRQLAG